MVENNKFKPIGYTSIYNDGIGGVTLYDASHANESEEQRIWTVTTIASLAYGNEEAKNPEALYERMKSIKHESLWEFIRIGGNQSLSSINNSMRAFMMNETSFPIINDNNWDEYTFDGNVFDMHKQNIACFRIKAPIFVVRQFMRHRSFSYLEMSRRYTKDSKVPFEFYVPNVNFETQCMIGAYHDNSINMYTDMINLGGLHTQLASRFLPQTTYTEFYMMGEVEGLKNFFTLRLDSHAQDEIREVATAMSQLLSKHQPELHRKVVL